MCTTSITANEIDRRLDGPREFYHEVSRATAGDMIDAMENAANVTDSDNASTTPASPTPTTETTPTPAGDDTLLAVDTKVDSEEATDGDIDALGAPVLITSSASRKRRLSDMNDSTVDVEPYAKRPLVSEQEKPVSPTSQDQTGCFRSSCGSPPRSPTERSSSQGYFDDHGYHSPAPDVECSNARLPSRRTLYIEYWSRTDECKERKWDHLDDIAEKYGSAEEHIFATTLNGRTAFLEPNMFPYDTPAGIEHWTLWHVNELSHAQIKQYVENWIDANAPHVEQWNYDDNPERSIDIFHVHVYLQVRENDSVLRGRKVEDLVHE